MSTYTFQQFVIPEHMMDGIARYIEHGIMPGSFLCAVISNNLSEAVARADSYNMAHLPAFAAYFYNEAPAPCWGSKEKMNAWMQARATARETAA